MSKDTHPSLSILTLAGLDASSFLQGYVTCEMEELAESQALPMGFTDIRGRVICNGWIFGTPERISIVIHNSLVGELKQHLSKYLLFSKAKFDDSAIPASIMLDQNAGTIVLQPFDWKLTIETDNDGDLGEAMIRGRYPILETRTTSMFLPQMIGLTDVDGVSFTKGCYLGQEVVARAEHRGQVKRTLRLFDWEGEHLSIGDAVKGTDSARGTVVALHENHALAVVNGNPDAMSASNATLIGREE